jgi:hypothetical protein
VHLACQVCLLARAVMSGSDVCACRKALQPTDAVLAQAVPLSQSWHAGAGRAAAGAAVSAVAWAAVCAQPAASALRRSLAATRLSTPGQGTTGGHRQSGPSTFALKDSTRTCDGGDGQYCVLLCSNCMPVQHASYTVQQSSSSCSLWGRMHEPTCLTKSTI